MNRPRFTEGNVFFIISFISAFESGNMVVMLFVGVVALERTGVSGATPSAEFSAICEYVWLMEKLEESSSSKWRKIIVGSGNRETFEKHAKNFHPWLGNVEIYFVDNEGKVKKIRNAVKLYAYS